MNCKHKADPFSQHNTDVLNIARVGEVVVLDCAFCDAPVNFTVTR